MAQNHIQISGNAGAGNGVVIETGTTAVTGNFYAIQVLVEATFSTFTENGASGDVMTSIAIPAGTILYNGLGITAFTMSAGVVRAYKSNA
jgi:hypothetical protein